MTVATLTPEPQADGTTLWRVTFGRGRGADLDVSGFATRDEATDFAMVWGAGIIRRAEVCVALTDPETREPDAAPVHSPA